MVSRMVAAHSQARRPVLRWRDVQEERRPARGDPLMQELLLVLQAAEAGARHLVHLAGALAEEASMRGHFRHDGGAALVGEQLGGAGGRALVAGPPHGVGRGGGGRVDHPPLCAVRSSTPIVRKPGQQSRIPPTTNPHTRLAQGKPTRATTARTRCAHGHARQPRRRRSPRRQVFSWQPARRGRRCGSANRWANPRPRVSRPDTGGGGGCDRYIVSDIF